MAWTEPQGRPAAEPRTTRFPASLLAPRFAPLHFPSLQIAGYAGSLLLTLTALALVSRHLLPPQALVATILGLAAIQALLQLSCFMHLRESGGPAWHLPLLALAIGIGVGIVGFSIWIMAFKTGVS